jgi:adenylyltransferase/sulfurtransferase
MDNFLNPAQWTRYERQLALPDITPAHQLKFKNTRILMIGAGGLGAAALPYLAGAGIGHITIIDDDKISTSNLHRQTIYKDDQAGSGKAEAAAHYLRALNPEIEIIAAAQRITRTNAKNFCTGFDLILDGSDNFETKTLLNNISVETQTPLIAASVERFEATAGIFAGHARQHPCYACLFPALPQGACNCNEAGVLGTVAGLAGLYQAHLTLGFLLALDGFAPGFLLKMDFKTLRLQKLRLTKDPACAVCKNYTKEWNMTKNNETTIPVYGFSELAGKDCALIDVRSAEEAQNDPVAGAINIPLPDLATQTHKIPTDRLVTLVCQKGIRSRQGAEMLRAFGFDNVCILDRFKGAA